MLITLVSFALMIVSPAWAGGDTVDMSVIRALAKRPVDAILANSPVIMIDLDAHWRNVSGRNRPMIVFFYANNNPVSQRLGTLVLYVAREYSDRVDFRSVKVSERGLPSKDYQKRLKSHFSLDKTPGILFYDNVKDKMVLEQKGYIDADYKAFQTPRMLLWRIYHAEVRKALDKLLAD